MKGQAIDQRGKVVVDRVDAGIPGANLRPVGVKLVGQQHRQTGMDPLPHLRLRHQYGDRAIGTQADPAVERQLPGRHGRQGRRHQTLSHRQQAPADRQAADRCNRSEDEIPACRHGPLAPLEVGQANNGATATMTRP